MQQQPKIPGWVSRIVVSLGAGGLFVIAFLDSSVLSFPFVADAMVIDLSIEHPARMPIYAAIATFGSLAGCVWLYLLAKKGGEAFFRRRAGVHADRTQRWVQQNGFVTMFISSILPPPLPLFKVVVLAEGVFQVRLRTFVAALLLGRGVRFLAEGIFAVKYGPAALIFLQTHKLAFAGWGLAILLLLWAASKYFLRTTQATEAR